MKSLMKVQIILHLVLLSSQVLAQTELDRVKVTKEISMKIPKSFQSMTQAERNSKYVSSRAPIAMYSSTGQEVDLGINENSSLWAADDYELLQDFHKANILNLFDEVQFIQEDIREIGDRTFVVFEFTSKVTDEETTFGGNNTTTKYTYIMYTVRSNKVLLFNFSCPARLRSEWQDTAAEIMNSVRIK